MGVQTPCRHLPFFPYLHTEVSTSWKNPYSALVDTQSSSTYSLVVSMYDQGHGAMPKRACGLSLPFISVVVEETYFAH